MDSDIKTKKARVFDINSLVEEAKQIAKERSIISGKNTATSGCDENLCYDDVENADAQKEQFTEECAAVAAEVKENSDGEEFGPFPDKFKTPNSSDESDPDDNDENELLIPTALSLSLRHGNKAISALTLDRIGDKLVAGGCDCYVSMWDFSRLDREVPMRSIQPCGMHQIRDVDFGENGNALLVVPASAQAKVLDRSGCEVVECIKGDQYLVDMNRTKGHVSALNGGCWHPYDRDEFLTCSDDGTVRFWNVNSAKFNHTNLIKVKSFKYGTKIAVKSCCYANDGNLIIAGSDDGTIQAWDRRKPLVTVAMRAKDAHTSFACSFATSYGKNFLASRSKQEMKLWDLRLSLKSYLSVVPDLEVKRLTNVCFSPNDNMVLTGTNKGFACFDTNDSLRKIEEFNCNSQITRIFWHPRIYQIIAGRSDGNITVYYDSKRSMRGATLGFKVKKKSVNKDFFSNMTIINPLSLPLFKQEKIRNLSVLRIKERQDAARSKRPELPISGPGEGGRLGTHGSTLSSYIIKNIALQTVSDTKEDPRAALLKYAEIAEKDPYWVSPAYKNTQPVTIFQPFDTDEQKAEDEIDEIDPPWKRQKSDTME